MQQSVSGIPIVCTIGTYYSARKEINLIEYFRAVSILANYFTIIALVFPSGTLAGNDAVLNN